MSALKKTLIAKPKNVGAQVDGFIDKFDPPMAKRIREVRAVLRKRFPTAIEMVYDNYNFFVIGYSPTERPTDYIVSLAANSKGVGLSFNHGADLADPHGILQGSGSQNRFVRLVDGAKTLKHPHVAAMIDAAVENSGIAFPKERGMTVVRSVSAKQRPRR
jgi:hypothetical protein